MRESAEAKDIVVHIHPPMLSVGNEVLMQYRLNEAAGWPFDATVTVARMIGSGVFDRHPKLQVLIVRMGGELPSILGHLDFTWQLNYHGARNPPAGWPYTNQRPPSEYFKTNILVDCLGFNPIGLRAAIEMCGVDRVVFGSDYGAVPYGIKEHVQIVEDVLPNPAERELVFWKTSNTVSLPPWPCRDRSRGARCATRRGRLRRDPMPTGDAKTLMSKTEVMHIRAHRAALCPSADSQSKPRDDVCDFVFGDGTI